MCLPRRKATAHTNGRSPTGRISPEPMKPTGRRDRLFVPTYASPHWTTSRGSRNEQGDNLGCRATKGRSALVGCKERALRSGDGGRHSRHARAEARRASSRSWLRRRRADGRDQGGRRQCAWRRSERRAARVCAHEGAHRPQNGRPRVGLRLPIRRCVLQCRLHSMRKPKLVIAGVYRALRSCGRFVAELGGHGNVAAIATAMRAVSHARNGDPSLLAPWFFPTVDEYSRHLTEAGFCVKEIALVLRPTPLKTGMDGWLRTFGRSFFVGEVVDLLWPSLCDSKGVWPADHVRLRFFAERGT